VRAGDCYGIAVIVHDLPEQLRPCEHGLSAPERFRKFRVVRMNGSGINDDVRFIADVVRTLGTGDHSSLRLKLLRQPGPPGIGSGYSKTFLHKNGSEPAHADAAYTDKVDTYGVLKIYPVHIMKYSLFSILQPAGAQIAACPYMTPHTALRE
jgi:hypothetical protein